MSTSPARPRRRRFLRVATLAATCLTVVGLTTSMAQSASVVDNYARYQPQVSCDPVAKPGVIAARATLRKQFGGGDYGIARACKVGGLSEHKEGRAWDWAFNANKKTDRVKAQKALTWLLADVDGEKAARARNLGIMYIIWNKRMWSSYRANEGWRPYTGANPHTDHIHISFTWNGATKKTVRWTGAVQPTDYGPCQTWIGEMARPWSRARLTPCPTPIKRPKATAAGIYVAQPGETVARVAKFFGRTEAQIRSWNGFPATGTVTLRVGQRIQVTKPAVIPPVVVPTPEPTPVQPWWWGR